MPPCNRVRCSKRPDLVIAAISTDPCTPAAPCKLLAHPFRKCALLSELSRLTALVASSAASSQFSSSRWAWARAVSRPASWGLPAIACSVVMSRLMLNKKEGAIRTSAHDLLEASARHCGGQRGAEQLETCVSTAGRQSCLAGHQGARRLCRIADFTCEYRSRARSHSSSTMAACAWVASESAMSVTLQQPDQMAATDQCKSPHSKSDQLSRLTCSELSMHAACCDGFGGTGHAFGMHICFHI